MSGTKSGSLRDLYASQPEGWSFSPPTNGSSSSSRSIHIAAPESYEWSLRNRPHSIYELSPVDFQPVTYSTVDFFRSVAGKAAIQYLCALVENPFEVGKTLLQVQYVPRESAIFEDVHSNQEQEEISDESSAADNEDSYFADEAHSISQHTPRPTDERGYIVRRDITDAATRPDWLLPPGLAGGVWTMMKQVAHWKPEGWLALWKGTATGCLKTYLENTLQPIIHRLLTSGLAMLFGASLSSFSRSHTLILPISSTVITGVLLSPLDLIRTRLIVQTSNPHHRRYSGPFDALNQILLHEGGIRGLYFHPNVLYPTILDCAARSLTARIAPFFITRLFSRIIGAPVTEDTHPMLTAVALVAGECAGLLITLPIETVRRRLQVQTRGAAPPLPACVELRRRPYAGIVDALYSIITEERSDLPLRRRRHRRKSSHAPDKAKMTEAKVEEFEKDESWWRGTGIGQLYRGIGMRATAVIIIFGSSVFAGEPHEGSRWTEL